MKFFVPLLALLFLSACIDNNAQTEPSPKKESSSVTYRDEFLEKISDEEIDEEKRLFQNLPKESAFFLIKNTPALFDFAKKNSKLLGEAITAFSPNDAKYYQKDEKAFFSFFRDARFVSGYVGVHREYTDEDFRRIKSVLEGENETQILQVAAQIVSEDICVAGAFDAGRPIPDLDSFWENDLPRVQLLLPFSFQRKEFRYSVSSAACKEKELAMLKSTQNNFQKNSVMVIKIPQFKQELFSAKKEIFFLIRKDLEEAILRAKEDGGWQMRSAKNDRDGFRVLEFIIDAFQNIPFFQAVFDMNGILFSADVTKNGFEFQRIFSFHDVKMATAFSDFLYGKGIALRIFIPEKMSYTFGLQREKTRVMSTKKFHFSQKVWAEFIRGMWREKK